jgi:hypothetical protein
MIKKGDRKVSYIDSKKQIEILDKEVIKQNRKSRNNLLQHIVKEYFKK